MRDMVSVSPLRRMVMNEGQGECVTPEVGLLDSLAPRISVELIDKGSRFPKLLCSVWVMLSQCWFCPCYKGMK